MHVTAECLSARQLILLRISFILRRYVCPSLLGHIIVSHEDWEGPGDKATLIIVVSMQGEYDGGLKPWTTSTPETHSFAFTRPPYVSTVDREIFAVKIFLDSMDSPKIKHAKNYAHY